LHNICIMKKTIWIIALLAFLAGCENAINITQPTILIQSAQTVVFDSISISVTENADIDGNRVVPEYYEWKILDYSENTLFANFPSEKNITWVPDSAGNFIISVKIGYDGNKSVTTLREVTVTECPASMQRRLVGHWTGTAEAMFGATWNIDITFTETGHYIATASNVSNPNYWPSPFYFGYKMVDNPAGGQMCIEPSADIPCQTFTIDEVINNKGYGVLNVGYEYAMSAYPYSYECSNNFEIQHLSFSDGGDAVFFSLVEFGTDYYDWYLRYNLIRVD